MKLPIGYSRKGLIAEDLREMPHLLVGGETGSGKSNFLHTAAITLARYEVTMFIIDLKRVEFGVYRDVADYAHTTDQALKILRFLKREMLTRQRLFDQAGVVHINEYNNIPYYVLIIDELSQLCPSLTKDKSEKEMRNEAHSLLVDILGLARALGIHCILGTQRPDKEVLPGQMKANIPATLAFRCRNRVNSQILIDDDSAAYLPKIPGRAVWQYGSTQMIVQTLLIKPSDVREWLVTNQKANTLPDNLEPPTGEL